MRRHDKLASSSSTIRKRQPTADPYKSAAGFYCTLQQVADRQRDDHAKGYLFPVPLHIKRENRARAALIACCCYTAFPTS